MSDEDENTPHAHFVMFDPREQIERQRMAHHVAVHGVMEFVHSLNEEQLEAFSMLMHSLADREAGPQIASKFEGIAEQVLHFKFKWCACGTRHPMVEDLLPSVEKKDGWYADDADPLGDVKAFQDKLFGGAYDTDGGVVLDTPEPADASEIQAAAERKKQDLLTEYNLIERDGRVYCKLCGVEYDSIRDRMLRAPHDCPSCNIKNAQG